MSINYTEKQVSEMKEEFESKIYDLQASNEQYHRNLSKASSDFLHQKRKQLELEAEVSRMEGLIENYADIEVELRAENAKLREALRKYGKHTRDCNLESAFSVAKGCNCELGKLILERRR